MGARGPAPRPMLEVVREGNPSKESKAKTEARAGVMFPPGAPDEPDWKVWFIESYELDNEVAAQHAASEWRIIVPRLNAVGRLATVDRTVLVEHCICVGRIVQLERLISREGISVQTERGFAKNPAVTAVNQYRAQLRHTMAQLMLTPAARARMGTPKGDDGGGSDSPFD